MSSSARPRGGRPWIGWVLAAALFGALFSLVRLERKPRHLRVYTNSSIAMSWGAGPELVAAFQSGCTCSVELVDVKDGGVLLQRLLLERDSPRADVVLGLDLPRLRYARNHLDFMPLDEQDRSLWRHQTPAGLGDYLVIEERFLAFDWSPITFLRSKEKTKEKVAERTSSPAPISIVEFLETDNAPWALPHPRTSTVGLSLLLWVYLEAGDVGLQLLKGPSLKMTTSNWSQAYSLFQQGRLGKALGFFSSLGFHSQQSALNAGGGAPSRPVEALRFDRHPPHLEYVAIPRSTREPALARSFVRFLMGGAAQKILEERNYMFSTAGVSSQEPVPLLPFNDWSRVLHEQDVILEKWDALGERGKR